jgi:hypothetical protein
MFGEIPPVIIGTYGGCFSNIVQKRLYEEERRLNLEDIRSKLEKEVKKVLPVFNARGKLVEDDDSGNILNFIA